MASKVVRSLAGLRPAAYNPRTISEGHLTALTHSLTRFGDISGIVWNRQTGNLVAGHQRVTALRAKYGNLRIVDGAIHAPDGKTFVVRVVDWDLATEKAANIAANSPTLQGEFTPDLAALMAEVKLDMPDAYLDLAMPDLASILNDIVPRPAPKPGLTDDDAVPDSAPSRTKPGDVWLCGRHRIMAGDSTKPEDVARLMAGGKADAVVTDPPYGQGYESADGKRVTGDKNFNAAADAFALCDSAVPWVVFFNDSCAREVLGLRKSKHLRVGVWHKSNAGGTRGTGFLKDVEFIAVFIDGNLPTGAWPAIVESSRSTGNPSWQTHIADRYLHPTQKPVKVVGYFVDALTAPLIHDPFLGSGTTLISCHKLDRICFGMEIDCHYTDICVKRWQDFTGRSATLESTGETFDRCEKRGGTRPSHRAATCAPRRTA
jgi:hypothetical protein